jgi:AsmA protein
MAKNKKLIYIAGGIVVLLLLVVLILPFMIDGNQYRPTIESMMTDALHRKVDIGNIRLSILSGGVSVDNLAIADDPAFGSEPFLKTKEVTVGVELIPLIFSRTLHVTGLTIVQPEVTLLRSNSGTWNFSSLGAGGSSPSSTGSSAATGLSIQKFTIRNGTLAVGNVGASSKMHRYDQVNLESSDLSYTTEFPFSLTAKTAGNGSVTLKGKAGPLNETNLAATPVDASLDVKNLDLAGTGFVEPSSGIAGLVDFSGTLNSDGKQMTSKGTATATKLQLVPGAMPAGQPVKVDYETEYQLTPQTGTLKQGDVSVGKALAQLTGTYVTMGDTTSLQLKLTGNNMPATDIVTLLPALNVSLPKGASLKEGTINLNMTISGPVNRLVTAGPVSVSNAKLTGFDLASQMKGLASFAGIPNSSDTVIQTLSSTLRVANEGMRADNFNLVVPAIGSMTGNGTINSNQALDFKMVAKLGNAASPLGAISSLASFGSGQGSKGGIPFHIGGTTSDPKFMPDLAGLAGGLAGGAGSGLAGDAASAGKALAPAGGDLGKTLGGLFGKKN